MLKHIVIISASAIVLFGCSEKKLTEEMLLGQWNCQNTLMRQINPKVANEFHDLELRPDYHAEYIKNGDQVLLKLASTSEIIDFDAIEKNKDTWQSIGEMETNNKIKFVLISNDELKQDIVFSIRDKTSKEIINLFNIEVICKRITD